MNASNLGNDGCHPGGRRETPAEYDSGIGRVHARPAATLSRWRRFDRRPTIAVMALVLTAALGLWMAPVGAHTALLQASPGPDQTAGGTIDFVDLAFLDPVSDAIVTLSFNGEPVAGVTTVSDGEIVRFELDDPIQLPGRYQVFYEMTSYDSDYTTSGYFFTYAADAPQPARIALPGDESGDTSLLPIVATVVGLASLVGLLAAFVWRLDAKRRQQIQADTGSASDW